MQDIKNKIAVQGSKKGGGGSTFREEENTLQTSQTVRSLFAISEGQIGGLVNGARSIYINDTPLQNADGTYNFGGRVAWDQRLGLPSQEYMAGFPSASTEFVVNTEVTNASPATRTINSNADAARVTIGLQYGLYEQLTDSNALVGTRVELAIDKKLSSSGAWVQDRTVVIDGKTTSPYADSYRIERPTGTGTWEIRLRRISADTAAATLKNNTHWNSYTEIQDVRLEYADTAYVGVAIDAKDLGSNQIPVLSFDIHGIIVRVPSNYDPATRTYTGTWDGTFKMSWTDNPAWHLFDLLTHPRYGLGHEITDDRVDKYSFYSAAIYNDELVPDGKGGQEPRFTCNVPIQAREEALRVCQNLAGVMRAKIAWMGGRVALLQDRPSSSIRLLTKANVIDGFFDYPGSTKSERHTVVHVTWNDPDDDYKQRTTTVEATAEQKAQFGQYNAIEQFAYGCTSEGQAIRFGKWYLDTVLNQTEFAKFSMSFNGFDLAVGDVVTIYDNDFAGKQNSGRLISGSTTSSIKLDRAATLTPGSTIEVQFPDGTLESRNVVESSGQLDTVTVSSPFSSAPSEHSVYVVTTSVSPRKFRITKLTQGSEKNVVEVEALVYDSTKYSRVEQGISIPAPVFSTPAETVTSAPTNLTINERAFYVDNALKRSLLVGWDRPASGNVTGYRIQYRINGAAWESVDRAVNSLEILDVPAGLFECRVVAISHMGLQSPPLVGQYTVTTVQNIGSELLPVTDLVSVETGATSFNSNDLVVQFTYPLANGSKPIALKDFEVRVINPNTNATVRTQTLSAVAPGETRQFNYTYATNRLDNAGNPLRSVKIEVLCRDANNRTSTATAQTFTNAAPSTPSNFTVFPGVGSNHIRYTLPTDPDFAGVLVWRDTTSNFTPSASNLICDTRSNYFADTSLSAGQTYYYRAAAYDSFSKPSDGTGLNVTAAISSTPIGVAIPTGAALPATGTEGDVFINTTDGQLYTYHSGAWTNAVPAVAIIGQLSASQIASINAAQVAGQLTASQIASINSTQISGQLTSSQIASVTAAQLTGQITSTQITNGAVSTPQLAAGAVTSSNIAAGAITAGTIATNAITAAAISSGSVTANALAANAVTAASIATNAITAAAISAGAVTTAKIAAGAITANEIATNAVTAVKIAAGAIESDKIAANAITSDKITANAITAAKIAAGTITANQIAAGTITSAQIASNYVYAGNISANQITTGSLDASLIGAGKATFRWTGTPPGAVSVGGDGSGTADPIFYVTRTGYTFVPPAYVYDTYGSDSGVSAMYVSSAANTGILSTTPKIAGLFSDSGSSAANLKKPVVQISGYRNEAQLLVYGRSGPTSPHAGRFYGGTNTSFNYDSSPATNAQTSAIIGAGATYAVYGEKGSIAPFTGSHDGLITKTELPEPGDILVDLSVVERNGINDTITEVTRCSLPYQDAIGVMSGRWGLDKMVPAAFRDDDNCNYTPAQYDPVTGEETTPEFSSFGYKLSYALCKTQFDVVGVNGLGEGQILVCGENGNINKGDLIVTSSMLGKGMRQGAHMDGDGVTYGSKQICTWSVARARESVTFDTADQVKLISCIYLCG